MNFYRDFLRERMKNVEEALVEASSVFDVDDDEELDAQAAMLQLGMLTAHANLAVSTLGIMAAGKVYKIGQTYQTIDACEREDYAADAEGVATAVTGVDDAAEVIFNPAPIGIGHGFSHPAYPRVISRVPIKNIHRLGPPGLFNGCLFRNCKSTYFTCRTKGFPSTTLLYNPAEDLLFSEPKPVQLPASFEYCSVEDVRMFAHRGSTLASFTLAGRTDKGWICQILLGELNEKRELAWVDAIPSPEKALVEKNWVFFSHEGKLFTVYYPAPHVVYEVKLHERKVTLGQKWEAENWKAADFMENARGGASPVRVGDEFWHFYHTQHRHGRGVAYQVGLYTFATQPPWNLKRIIKGPLLSMVPSKRELDCIFPTGAALENEKWHLSCGVQDHETVAVTLEHADLERLLTKI
jgi:predicted GH43/DUF377 family glycosyl hydrolase